MILFKWFFWRALATSGALWLTLLLFVGFFEFLRRADDYSFIVAAGLAVLSLPQLALAVAPFACAVGGAVMCRQMEEKRELPIMRISGLSPPQITRLCLLSALIFSAAYAIVSELLLDKSDALSRALQGKSAHSRHLWLAGDDGYAQVGELHAGGDFMRDIVLYETELQTLRAVVTAAAAHRQDDQWWLVDGEYIRVQEDAAAAVSRFDRRRWRLNISPSSLEALSLRPRDMAMRRLGKVMADLQDSGQNSAPYRTALWRRMMDFLALPLLCACGIWFVGRPQYRRMLGAALGGAAIGGGYFLLSLLCAIFAAHFAAAVVLPPLALAAAVALGARRRL